MSIATPTLDPALSEQLLAERLIAERLHTERLNAEADAALHHRLTYAEAVIASALEALDQAAEAARLVRDLDLVERITWLRKEIRAASVVIP